MNKNLAVIENASTNYFDRHILMVNAIAHYEDGGSQNVLGLVLDIYDKEKEQRVGTIEGMNFLVALLQFFGVDNLTEVKNHICYVIGEGEGLSFRPRGLEQLNINPNQKCSIKKIIYSDYFKSE